ncbi:MAG: response regulator [Sulfurimonadaceae bacterium]
MENLQDVIRLGAKLDILYVEDDKALSQETSNILEKIFKSVDTASSGAEGLLKFTQNSYDLVITDIEMPELNGLEMSKKIKEIDPQILIVVISAYSNSSYLIEAINIGINYYVLKPILLPQLLSTLHSVVEVIENRRVAFECHQKEVQESIRVANEKLFHAMTKSSPNPVIICDGRHVAFYNEAFEGLFDASELSVLKEEESPLLNFLERKIAVDQLFKNDNEFVEDLDFMNLEDGEAIKLSLKTKLGTKIYLLIKNRLQIDKGNAMVMFTFNDITVLSFQNIQLKEYDKVIGKMTEEDFRSNSNRVEADIINKTSFETE